jgi:hypothetical protein
MTRWRCPICGELIPKQQLFPIRDNKTRKWVGAYHRICMDILLADLMAWFDACERERDVRRRQKHSLALTH